MPYIPRTDREEIRGMSARRVETPGELNYKITTIIKDYLPKPPGYTDYNEVIGVLECIKQEIYRRLVAPYEDCAILRNGDVFESERVEGEKP